MRLHALLALSEMPESEEAGQRALRIGRRPRVLNDRWLPDALTIAAARHGSAFLRAALADPNSPFGAAPRELVPNPGFEAGSNSAWKPHTFAGKAEFALDTKVVAFGQSLPADLPQRKAPTRVGRPESKSSLTANIGSPPGSNAADLKRPGKGGRGALVNLQGLPVQTRFVIGTQDWKQVTATFNSEERTESISICSLADGAFAPAPRGGTT